MNNSWRLWKLFVGSDAIIFITIRQCNFEWKAMSGGWYFSVKTWSMASGYPFNIAPTTPIDARIGWRRRRCRSPQRR